MRRRSLARAARFRAALRSGFALGVFTDAGCSIVTAGPPSVAILVAAILLSSDGASATGSVTVDAAMVAGGVSAIAASFTSSVGVGVTLAGALPVTGGVSAIAIS